MNGAVETAANGIPSSESESGDDEYRPTLSKPLRELMAQLDDEDAARFDTYLDYVDAPGFARLAQEVETMGGEEARIAWIRGVLHNFEQHRPADGPSAVASTVSPAPAPSAAVLPDVPASLIPILLQLSPEERAMSVQLVATLDTNTLEKFAAQLTAMPAAKALATVRRALDEAQRRRASVAHRAIATALRSESEGAAS